MKKKRVAYWISLLAFCIIFTCCAKEEYVKIYQVHAHDPEGGKVSYSLSDDYDGLFKVNQRGEIFRRKNMNLDPRTIKEPIYLFICDPEGGCDSLLLVLPVIKKKKNERNLFHNV